MDAGPEVVPRLASGRRRRTAAAGPWRQVGGSVGDDPRPDRTAAEPAAEVRQPGRDDGPAPGPGLEVALGAVSCSYAVMTVTAADAEVPGVGPDPRQHASRGRSGRRGSTGGARPRSGGTAAGSARSRTIGGYGTPAHLPSPAFPILTPRRPPGFDPGPAAGPSRGTGVPIGCPTRWERSRRHRAAGVPCGSCPAPADGRRPGPRAYRRRGRRRRVAPPMAGQGGASTCRSTWRQPPSGSRSGAAASLLVAAACGTATTPTAAHASAPAPRRTARPRAAAPPGAPERRRPARSTCSHRLRARRDGSRRRHGHHRRLAGGHPVQPVLPDPGHRGQRRVRDVGDARRRSPTTTSTRPTSRPRSRPSTTAASRSRATTATR